MSSFSFLVSLEECKKLYFSLEMLSGARSVFFAYASFDSRYTIMRHFAEDGKFTHFLREDGLGYILFTFLWYPYSLVGLWVA